MTTLMLFDPNSLDTPGNRCSDEWVDTPEHRAFLDWCRSEGITPEDTARLEIVQTRRGYKAKLSVYDNDENGRRVIARNGQDFSTHAETRTIATLPPLT